MILTLLILLLSFFPLKNIPESDCVVPNLYSTKTDGSEYIGGLFKPFRTDSADGRVLPHDASLRVIIVFVQFPDEPAFSNSAEWPIGQAPVYLNSLLSTQRKNSLPYYDRYDEEDEIMSDYYQEVSGGMFHMTGITRHFIFEHNRSWYNGNVSMMNAEIYNRLKQDQTIDWKEFDKWQYVSDGKFRYEGEGLIDMLMMVRRTFSGAAGFAGLDGSDFVIDGANGLTIKSGYDQLGSGLVQQGNQGVPNSFQKFFGILVHEYGHFHFGPSHSPIGIMTSRGGITLNDLFFSPFEKYKLGYISPRVADYNRVTDYVLSDISGRDSGSFLLKVPIDNHEFFLIENRRKLSRYDVKMLGDTTRLNFLMNTGEYGKGIYIYHHEAMNLNYSNQQDEECADGLWNWRVFGTAYPDWSNNDKLERIMRYSLPQNVLNDNGDWRSLFNRDGISANYSSFSQLGPGVYFNIGKKSESIQLQGVDREFTNAEEAWTSRELFGDRYDAWNIGYNEIFSPYSNPNTKNWYDVQTGIFIHYYKIENNKAYLKIYRKNNPYSETQILKFTPPSKPMGLYVDYFSESLNIKRPKLNWNHCTEPDMADAYNRKTYRIYRARSENIQNIPYEYELIDSVSIRSDSVPVYVDRSVLGLGSRIQGNGNIEKYAVRYKVQAVDKYRDSSVRSDFAGAICLKPDKGTIYNGNGYNNPIKGDTLTTELLIPENYRLSQNYPNPFNASTVISFDLPVSNNVLLKLFDVTGKEVATIINGYRNAGSHRLILGVDYPMPDISSGVYFYRIISGNFSAMKRFVLMK